MTDRARPPSRRSPTTAADPIVAKGSPERIAFAPAKINLTLRIGGRRPDGYHDLASLVVFADAGDELRLVPGDAISLSVTGQTAAQAGPLDDNLVLTAVRMLQARIADLRSGHFHLTKRLPVAAGIGGGSSDAAAALRLVAQLNEIAADDPRVAAAARATGADVPVCLDPRPRIMRGIGELLSAPVGLPALHAVLVNARVPVPTGAVFGALAKGRDGRPPPAIDNDPAARLAGTETALSLDALLQVLSTSGNDLEAPALALFPVVGETLAALRSLPSCRLARMSGSGGTCFGLFASANESIVAATALRRNHPGWWVQSAALGAADAAPQ